MNDRELATLIWLAIFIGCVLAMWDVRGAVPSMLKAAATPKLVVPFAAMALWISGLIYAASKIGLWTDSQIGDTLA